MMGGQERAILITGASTGIGRATAEALAGAGYRVFAGIRAAADAAALRADNPDRLIPVRLDVTDPASVRAAAEEVSSAVSEAGIAGLVNNAGIGLMWPMEAIPLEVLRQQYDVNVFGVVTVTQGFLPLLRAGGGRLINIGSVGDRLTLPFGAPLTSSKWALASITEALRLELRPWGIHVVLIEPGTIRTAGVDKVEAYAEQVAGKLDKAGYAGAYRSMIRRMVAREKTGSSPDVVAHSVLRALSASRPRTRYLVGKDARALATVARWAPDRLLDRLELRAFGLPKSFGALRPESQRSGFPGGPPTCRVPTTQ